MIASLAMDKAERPSFIFLSPYDNVSKPNFVIYNEPCKIVSMGGITEREIMVKCPREYIDSDNGTLDMSFSSILRAALMSEIGIAIPKQEG
jgi:hypothetical protein